MLLPRAGRNRREAATRLATGNWKLETTQSSRPDPRSPITTRPFLLPPVFPDTIPRHAPSTPRGWLRRADDEPRTGASGGAGATAGHARPAEHAAAREQRPDAPAADARGDSAQPELLRDRSATTSPARRSAGPRSGSTRSWTAASSHARSTAAASISSWRLLNTDPADVSFNLYRSTDGGAACEADRSSRSDAPPISSTPARRSVGANAWWVKAVVDGREQAESGARDDHRQTPRAQPYVALRLQGRRAQRRSGRDRRPER